MLLLLQQLSECDLLFSIHEKNSGITFNDSIQRERTKSKYCKELEELYIDTPYKNQTQCLTPNSPFYAEINSLNDVQLLPFKLNSTKPSFLLYEYSLLHPAINQGTCGSCYAIPAKYIFEAILYLNNYNYSARVSLQQLISGSTSGNNNFCNGGHFQYIIQDLIHNKFNLTFDEISPYKSMFSSENSLPAAPINSSFPSVLFQVFEIGACKKSVFTVKNKHKWTIDQVLVIKNILNRGLPLAGQIHLHSGKQYRKLLKYQNGIIQGSCNFSYSNHQVLLVGYGKFKGKDVWVFQNSWGIKWGVNGLFYVEIGSNAFCSELEAYFVVSADNYLSEKPSEEWKMVKRGQNGLDFDDGNYQVMSSTRLSRVITILRIIGVIISYGFFILWLQQKDQNVTGNWILVNSDKIE